MAAVTTGYEFLAERLLEWCRSPDPDDPGPSISAEEAALWQEASVLHSFRPSPASTVTRRDWSSLGSSVEARALLDRRLPPAHLFTPEWQGSPWALVAPLAPHEGDTGPSP